MNFTLGQIIEIGFSENSIHCEVDLENLKDSDLDLFFPNDSIIYVVIIENNFFTSPVELFPLSAYILYK